MQNIRCATCFCIQEHTIAQWLCKIAGATLHTYAPEENAPVPGMQLSSDTVIQLSKFNPSFQSGMHLCTCNETFPGCNAACSDEKKHEDHVGSVQSPGWQYRNRAGRPCPNLQETGWLKTTFCQAGHRIVAGTISPPSLKADVAALYVTVDALLHKAKLPCHQLQ